MCNKEAGARKEFRQEKRGDPRPYGHDNVERQTDQVSSNDLSWYARYPGILEPAARIPFAKTPGMKISVMGKNYNIPGVIALDFLPSIGYSNNHQSGPSQLALELYARVRANYSSSLEADGPDMVVYVMAIANAYMYISYLKRIYRTVNSYSPINYLTPHSLLQAYGLDSNAITNLRNKLDLFRSYINQLIAAMRVFRVPAEFDVMRRYVWLCDNVFMDAEDLSEAQLYCFVPRGFYTYATQNTPDGVEASGLEMLEMPMEAAMAPAFDSDPAEFLFKYGMTLISNLKDWETSLTISGYFQRAFSNANWFAMDEIPEGDLQVPFYNEEVLGQIENFLGIPVSSGAKLHADRSGMNVSQNPKTNAILSANTVYATVGPDAAIPIPTTPCMNMRDKYDPGTIVINSRMMAMTTTAGPVSGATSKFQYVVDSGTEVPLWMRLILPQYVSDSVPLDGAIIGSYHAPSTATAVYPIGIFLVESFDWHPFMYYVTGNTVVPIGDLHKFAPVPRDAIERLHQICLFSEYNAFSLI